MNKLEWFTKQFLSKGVTCSPFTGWCTNVPLLQARLSRVDLSWNRLGLACAKNQNPSKVGRTLGLFWMWNKTWLKWASKALRRSCEGAGDIRDKQRFLNLFFLFSWYTSLQALISNLSESLLLGLTTRQSNFCTVDFLVPRVTTSAWKKRLPLDSSSHFLLELVLPSQMKKVNWGSGELLWPDACGSVGHEHQALSFWHLIQRHWNRGLKL